MEGSDGELAGFFFKNPHEPVNCWLPPLSLRPFLSLSFSFPFFLNTTWLGSEVYSESQVILGVYQKEKLGMFKNHNLTPGINPSECGRGRRCVTAGRALLVSMSHFRAYE